MLHLGLLHLGAQVATDARTLLCWLVLVRMLVVLVDDVDDDDDDGYEDEFDWVDGGSGDGGDHDGGVDVNGYVDDDC